MKRENTPAELTTQVLVYFGIALFLVAIGFFTIHSGVIAAISIWIAALVLAGYAGYIVHCIKTDQIIVVTGTISEVAMSNKLKLLQTASKHATSVKYIVLKDDSDQLIRINTRKRLSFVPEKGESISIYLSPRTQVYKVDEMLMPSTYLLVKANH